MSKDKNFLWNLLFYVMLAGFCLLVYVGSSKVSYNWHWDRVPDYIVYTGTETIKTPFDGIVSVKDGVLSVEPDIDAEKDFVVEKPGELVVEDGDMVLEGDTLSSKYVVKAGPLLMGLFTTLYVSMISIVLAIIIGLMTGLARISKNPALKKLAILYIEIIRGTPLLVQIFIFYFFIGTILGLDRMTSGVLALSFFAGAYIAEIVRAGIQSIPKGQMEAARSLGMSYVQAMRHVILPQAFKRTLPPMAGQFISLIKDSSLVSVISITDLTKAGREVVSSNFSAFEVWFTVALMYLVLTSSLSYLVQKLELKMSEGD